MTIRKFADIRLLIETGDLSDAEQELIRNCKSGKATTLVDGERPSGPSPERTIRADLLRYLILGGCEECEVHQWGVTLMGAWISGSLDFGFTIANGATELYDCVFDQKIEVLQARFELLNLSGSALQGLDAQGVRVTRNVKLDGVESRGEVNLSSAEIGGQLDCDGAELDGSGGKALNAQGIRVTGDVFLHEVKTTGEVTLSGAQIGGQLGCIDAELDGRGKHALNTQGLRVKEGVFLRGLKSMGVVSLSGAEIGGQLDCGEADLDGGDGKALNAQRLIVKESFFWRQVKSVKGFVDLTAAQLGDLADDTASWDKVKDMGLIGFTYDNLVGPTDLKMRKAWLKKGAQINGSFHPQPYQQLAKVLRDSGHRREARDILIEKEIQQRRAARKRWSDERHFRSELRRFVLNASDDAAKKVAARAAKAPELSETWVELFGQRFHNTEFAKSRDPMVAQFLQQDVRNQLLWDNVKAFSLLVLNFLWSEISRRITGYGYKPWRSLYWMVGLFFFVTLVSGETWDKGDFAPNAPVILISQEWKDYAETLDAEGKLLHENPAQVWASEQGPGRDYETFNPFFYAADVVIPIIDIGQTDAWAPSTTRGPLGRWLFAIQKVAVILGWGLTAIFAAAVTGMIRRDD